MDNQTLIIHWLFSWIALLIMGTRLVWRRVAKETYNMGDYCTIGAIVCALARLSLIHVTLIWGTNKLSDAYRSTHVLTATDIYQREIGSKLVIVNRFFYNSYLWLQKLTLLDLNIRLIRHNRFEKVIIRAYLVVFFISYVAVQVMTFAECRPFHLYWQVVPSPGKCAEAQIQLFVLGTLNIITDIMLFVLPIPVVLKLQVPWRKKAQIVALFALGVFIIAITLIRLPINSSNGLSQDNRTTWMATELVTSAIVVNAPAIYGLWNKKRVQQRTLTHQSNTRSQSGSRKESTYKTTILGSGDSYSLGAMPKVGAGILQTREVIIVEDVQGEGRRDKDDEELSEELGYSTRCSSEREFMRG